jgi:hypothetical protein
MRTASFLFVALAAIACDSSKPTSVDPTPAASIARGNAAFLTACASCHASRDGFDLAFFGFPDSVIVRRALKHVSRATGEDIAAYIRSLPVSPVGERHRLFQPANAAATSDGDFWTKTFGVAPNTWPSTLTVERLRSLNPRDVPLPFQLPVWSSEGDDDDWMPDVPLSAQLQAAKGGAVRNALASYYQNPSDASLIAAVNVFRDVVRPAAAVPTSLCYGDPGFQTQANECFQAMRWMSTLTAVHLARRGVTSDVPLDITRLWWETGEAAVSSTFIGSHAGPTRPRVTRTAGWLSLAFSFAPLDFRDGGAYQGQFLQQAEFTHYALFVELYRMVNDGRVNAVSSNEPESEYQRFRNGSLAVLRAPNVLRYQTAIFVLDYLLSRLEAGETYGSAARAPITQTMTTFDIGLRDATTADASVRAAYVERRAQFDARLQQAFRAN